MERRSKTNRFTITKYFLSFGIKLTIIIIVQVVVVAIKKMILKNQRCQLNKQQNQMKMIKFQ